MFQRDYILRMIEQMTSIVGRYVLLLQEQKKPQEVIYALEDFYGKLMLPPSKLLIRMSDEELLGMVSVNGMPDLDKTTALASLLCEEGLLYEDLGRPEESLPRLSKSLSLFLTAEELGANVSGVDIPEQIARVRKHLSFYEPPAGTLVRLFRYEEGAGRYGGAEDVLFELVELYPTEEHVKLGEEFFARLHQRSNEELEAGGLPREELEDGLLALRKLMTEAL